MPACQLKGCIIADLLALPPGFRAFPVFGDPFNQAVAEAAARDPGAVLWTEGGGRCRAAILLAPDRPITVRTLTAMGVLALYDALAVLAPPQMPIDVQGDGCLAVDGGRAAWVQAALGEDQPLEWAALGIEVALTSGIADPGEEPGETCLAEEGFGDVTAAVLLAGFCRHLLAWIEAWRDEVADALARAVAERGAGRMVRA